MTLFVRSVQLRKIDMLHELLRLLKREDPSAIMGEGLEAMVQDVTDVVDRAGTYFFDHPAGTAEREEVRQADRKINKWERKIRKQVIAHLTVSAEGADAAYGVLLLNVVKDLERVGDYAKNLAEVYEEGGGPIPPAGEANADSLRELRVRVEELTHQVGPVFSQSDTEGAVTLIRTAKELQEESDALIRRITKGDYDAATAVTLVLGARYYKRIAAHLANVLTGVVMPLHRLDYYDERRLEEVSGRE